MNNAGSFAVHYRKKKNNDLLSGFLASDDVPEDCTCQDATAGDRAEFGQSTVAFLPDIIIY